MRLLHFNAPAGSRGGEEDLYKVLVLDDTTKASSFALSRYIDAALAMLSAPGAGQPDQPAARRRRRSLPPPTPSLHSKYTAPARRPFTHLRRTSSPRCCT